MQDLLENLFHLAGLEFRHSGINRSFPAQRRVWSDQKPACRLAIVPGVFGGSNHSRQTLGAFALGRAQLLPAAFESRFEHDTVHELLLLGGARENPFGGLAQRRFRKTLAYGLVQSRERPEPAASLSPSARITGVDISPEMVRRTRREWNFAVEVCVADVLAWDGEAAMADVVVSSFGLKTFDREQQRRLAQTVARLLKPGGCYSFVEISVPSYPLLRALYLFYLKRVIPLMGRALPGDPECYRFFGCASGVRGRKPG